MWANSYAYTPFNYDVMWTLKFTMFGTDGISISLLN